MRFPARRRFLVGAVLAALVMLMVPALAGADDDDDGGEDRAFCAPARSFDPGQCSIDGLEFDFNARSGPNGENPRGRFRLEQQGGIFYEIEITCLQVTGNVAAFGGRVTASNVVPVGTGLAHTVVDNSPGPDLISPGTDLPAGPSANTPNCGDTTSPTLTVTGNIVVQDETGDDDDDDDDDD